MTEPSAEPPVAEGNADFGRGEVVVVAGLSGAGRSTAADALEDIGWFVIDNLPPTLIPKVAELTEGSGSAVYERIALVVGTGQHQADVLPALRWLEASGLRLRVVFLDASTEMLMLRYKVRPAPPPPLASGRSPTPSSGSAQVLEPVRTFADLVIDTTNLNVHQLRDRVVEAFAPAGATGTVHTRVVSFAYKHGVPSDADMVLDCRFLPNPHWVEDLRPLTGLDEPVRRYVLGQDLTGAFLAHLEQLFGLLVPAFVAEGKTYLTIAFGCTGGRHRSVAVAEEVTRMLSSLGVEPQVSHRDLEQ